MLVVAGEVFWDEVGPGGPMPRGVEVVSLVERFGRERATEDVLGCVSAVVAEHLGGIQPPS